MCEIDVNEVYCIRKLLSCIIAVAIEDSRNNSKFKSKYKQDEIDKNRENAIAWLEGCTDSKIKFQEICDALSIDSECVMEFINRK